MRGAVALAIVLGALALLVLFGSHDTVAGLRPEQLASAASLLAIGVFVFGWVISHYRGQWSRALEALAGFMVRWPDHPYVENALYWRGEVYFARGEHLRAAEQFEAVLARFGGGNKAPDALLKIGMCHDRLGSADRAKEYWERLRRDYPRSDAVMKIPQSTTDESRGRGVGPKESR